MQSSFAKRSRNLAVRQLRHLPRFRAARRAMQTLADRETWSRTDIDAFQLERLNGIWSHAIAHVPYYAQLRADRRLPQRFASLTEYQNLVPILEKDDVRQQGRNMLSAQARGGRWFRTGGSTGTPVSFYWDASAYREILRSRYRFYDSWGVDAYDRMAFLWGHDGAAAGAWQRFKRHLTDAMRNRIRLSAYDLDPDALRNSLKQMQTFEPASLYGFANAVHLLAREARRSGLDCPSLRMVTMTAEPVYPWIVREVEKAFGVPGVIEYGSSECGAIAFEAPDRTLRVREDVVLVETLPSQDVGYDIVLTVLNNPHFPLLRYRIGDMTDQPLETPNNGFSILQNIAGRADDLIVTRSGRPVHPTLLEAVFEDHPQCKSYRVHQQADGSLDVKFVKMNPKANVDCNRIRQELMMLMEGASVMVSVVKAEPLTAAGKHRILTSDMDITSQV